MHTLYSSDTLTSITAPLLAHFRWFLSFILVQNNGNLAKILEGQANKVPVITGNRILGIH